MNNNNNIHIKYFVFLASPRWRLELRDAVINRPNTLRLSCEVVGNPSPTVQWEKDSKSITATERVKITQESQRSTLEITTSAFEDSGVYTCTAVNEHGHVTTSCIAQVRGNLKNKLSFIYFTAKAWFTLAILSTILCF